MKKNSKWVLLLLTVLSVLTSTYAQINENHAFAQEYLYRMAQKGIIEIQDYILPLDRSAIAKALTTIEKNGDKLSTIEKKELAFLQQEYYPELISANSNKVTLLKKDVANRYRAFAAINTENTQIFLDPLAGANFTQTSKGYNLTTFGGARLYGYINKNIGFNLSLYDMTEFGDSINFTKNFTPDQGVINTSRNPRELNYSRLNFNIAYKWKNGMLSIGKDNINWGYGTSGKIILSSKAPSFPYLKLDYQPFKWMRFNYMHAWLNSDVIDSNRTYNTGTGLIGGVRQVYVDKFLATHSLSFIPKKGLEITLGESILYSDRLDVGYLIPINFFKFYEQHRSNYNLTAGSNTQFFAQVSSRNHLKNTHAYAVLFIDELYASKMFNRNESRNQLGFTLGINKTDFLVHYLTAGIEYSRLNPFVYNNIIPAQTYQHSSFSLGDWMGSNADRLHVFINYTPIAKLKMNIAYQVTRKGDEGTLTQQYFQQPQPPFLFGTVNKTQSILFTANYEWLNRLNILARATYLKQSNSNNSNTATAFSLGFSYGL